MLHTSVYIHIHASGGAWFGFNSHLSNVHYAHLMLGGIVPNRGLHYVNVCVCVCECVQSCTTHTVGIVFGVQCSLVRTILMLQILVRRTAARKSTCTSALTQHANKSRAYGKLRNYLHTHTRTRTTSSFVRGRAHLTCGMRSHVCEIFAHAATTQPGPGPAG